MSANLITFANLGTKADISAIDILPIVDKFHSSGDLRQVIGKTNKNFYIKNSCSAIPLTLHYCIRIIQELGIRFKRTDLENLFDIIVSRRLQKADVTFFHGGFMCPRALLRAKKIGSISVDIPRLAHLSKNAILEKEEMSLLGISEYKSYYQELNRKHKHLNKFDYVIGFSDFVRSSYVENGYPADRVFIAPQDIDVNHFSPLPKTKDDKIFRVIYVGYSNPLKGVHYLLDAWNKTDFPNKELLLVGGYGEMPPELKARYEKIISSNDTIKLIGHTNNKQLVDFYRNSQVLVFPSLTESLSRVTLEAMACGLPVITTENAKGLVEDGKTGFVVPIRDPQAIKEKIEFLYHNTEIREKMGREARKAMENKKPFGEAVYEIYQEIMRREGKLK